MSRLEVVLLITLSPGLYDLGWTDLDRKVDAFLVVLVTCHHIRNK